MLFPWLEYQTKKKPGPIKDNSALIKEIAFCNSLLSTDDETFPSRLIRQLTPSLKYRGTSGDGLLTCVR